MTAAVPPEALDVISAAATATGHIRPVPDRGADDLQGALAEVDFLVLDHERDDIRAILGQLPRLQVVQIMTAGTDWITPALPHRVTLCTASGSRDVPVAEWVLAALFGASTGLLESVRTQSAAHWEHFRHDEVTDKVVLILGLGSIGRAVQIRLQALGAEVIGIARTPREGVHSLQDFPELLGRADALVVLAPLTEQTKGIVDAAMLSRLRDGALVVNAGRGGVIDTPAPRGTTGGPNTRGTRCCRSRAASGRPSAVVRARRVHFAAHRRRQRCERDQGVGTRRHAAKALPRGRVTAQRRRGWLVARSHPLTGE